MTAGTLSCRATLDNPARSLNIIICVCPVATGAEDRIEQGALAGGSSGTRMRWRWLRQQNRIHVERYYWVNRLMSCHLDGVACNGIFVYASNKMIVWEASFFLSVEPFVPDHRASKETIKTVKTSLIQSNNGMCHAHPACDSSKYVCKSRPESKRIGGAILLETRSTMTESGPISISLSCISDNDKKKRQLS